MLLVFHNEGRPSGCMDRVDVFSVTVSFLRGPEAPDLSRHFMLHFLMNPFLRANIFLTFLGKNTLLFLPNNFTILFYS